MGFIALICHRCVVYLSYGTLRDPRWRSINYWSLPSRTFYAAGRIPGGSGYSWNRASPELAGGGAQPSVWKSSGEEGRGAGVLLLLHKLRRKQTHSVHFPSTRLSRGQKKILLEAPDLWEFLCSAVILMPPPACCVGPRHAFYSQEQVLRYPWLSNYLRHAYRSLVHYVT